MAIDSFAAQGENMSHEQESKESAVGINTFVRPGTSGFICVIKQRYTDFLVHEILPNGQILHLEGVEHGQKETRKRVLDPEVGGTEAVKKARVDSAPSNAVDHSTEDKEAKTHNEEAIPRPGSQSASTGDSLGDAASTSISEEDRNTLFGIFGESTTTAILKLYASVSKNPHRGPRGHAVVESEPIPEKSKRTEAHVCIRRIFSSRLQTSTIQDQAQQSGPGTMIAIKAAPPNASNTNNESRHGAGPRGKQAWDDLGGEYLHFTLYKENKDTMEVLYFLASQLKLHVKYFSFAGTKDRKGVTVQRVAIQRVREDRMKALNRLARGWRLGGPWEYKKDALQLGMLSGNEFLLTLRNARFPGEQPGWTIEHRTEHATLEVQTAAKDLTDRGFVNYYGLQRFGTHIVGTHVVGMKMLKGDLKGAVDAILTYDPSLVESKPESESLAETHRQNDRKIPQDDITRANAIHAFVASGSTAEAFSKLSGSRFQAEKNIMTHLGKRDRKTGKKPNENDFQGALMQIQRNLRLMYVHAYQSFIWNAVAGKRWELYGDKVIEGDLVVIGEKEHEEGTQNGTGTSIPEVDDNGEPIILPSASAAVENGNTPNDGQTAGVSDDPFVRARPLTKDEAGSGRFTIFDLVLPLPGFDVVYPENDIGTFYKEFMKSEAGGGLDPQNMRRGWKDISLSGGYRKMMARPLGEGVTVEVRAYSAEDEQMVETDLEKIEGKRPGPAKHQDSVGETRVVQDKIAVLLRLQLGTSQYATMALRELTKGGAMAYKPDYSVAQR